MHFKKFIIKRYKAIEDNIIIDLQKNSLIPIIGINECGKTTILNAIFAFDHTNDIYNSTIKQLTDVHNLYGTTQEPAIIAAEIHITLEELKSNYLNYHKKIVGKDNKEYKAPNYRLPKNNDFKDSIIITRTLSAGKSSYSIEPKYLLKDITDENGFCEELILRLPYILYFDDFRDSFPDKLEIKRSSNGNAWLDIIEILFKKTDESYSIYKLSEVEKRMRSNILLDVEKKLNKALTKEWVNFRLDDRDALEIKIEFDTEEELQEKETKQKSNINPFKEETIKVKEKVIKHFLIFEVVEKNPEGRERTFYVRDRSKGFYWFFNFVMKLEFNSKFLNDGVHTIYLLDEPGSYLHPYAQNKLSKKLVSLSEQNKVLYCTHTHYLLNPDVIPLNTIHIAEKTNFGKIHLKKFNEYSKSSNNLQSAFQPIYDALYIKPFNLELSFRKILVVEGIYDYYSFTIFREQSDFGIMPGKGADSLINLISLMIAFDVDFKVLWDNDKEGLESKEKATRFFGEELAARHFFNLENTSSDKKRILQDLFIGTDIELIKKSLDLPKDVSFNKTISALFFSEKRSEIISLISQKTKDNFQSILSSLGY